MVLSFSCIEHTLLHCVKACVPGAVRHSDDGPSSPTSEFGELVREKLMEGASTVKPYGFNQKRREKRDA